MAGMAGKANAASMAGMASMAGVAKEENRGKKACSRWTKLSLS